MAQIEEVIGGESAMGEAAGADVLLEGTGTDDPTAPIPEEPIHQAPQVDLVPMLEMAISSWNAIAEPRWPKWVFTEREGTALATAWAPVVEKYAGEMNVETAAILATIPILIPRLTSPRVIDVEPFVDPDAAAASDVEPMDI